VTISKRVDRMLAPKWEEVEGEKEGEDECKSVDEGGEGSMVQRGGCSSCRLAFTF